ncbi:MAG: ABC-2 transporter permease [Oscillospiraceae bacterium]|nr:ABC-2 transporter permease [Oscillospiraceae bacterium]
MTGLLLKDSYLILQRKQTLFLLLAISLLMGYTIDGAFIVGYVTFLSLILSIGTISYDEADNSLLFLMTLPFERRTYVLSKYVLSWIVCGIAWVISLFLLFLMNTIKGLPLDFVENITGCLVVLVFVVVGLDMMIPIQLKFGAEKSRTVMIMIVGVVMAVSILFGKVLDLDAFLQSLDRIPLPVYAVVGVVITITTTVGSVAVSTRIMDQKLL